MSTPMERLLREAREFTVTVYVRQRGMRENLTPGGDVRENLAMDERHAVNEASAVHGVILSERKVFEALFPKSDWDDEASVLQRAEARRVFKRLKNEGAQ